MRIPLASLIAAALTLAAAPPTHNARGLVLKSDPSHHVLLVSCEPIPNYMDAMEMEFTVRDPKPLTTLKPGQAITFRMLEQGQKLYAEDIHPSPTASFESEPMSAGQLTALNTALQPETEPLSIGDPVPDFALTDQTGASIHLTQFTGKVVAITFGYSRCPNPNYCFRLSNNLARVERHWQSHPGRDLILLTIMIDPDHDQGDTLTKYAAIFQANPADWHFLTGPVPQIHQIAALFGMNFWNVEGLLTHTLHTVLLDRRQRLAVNLEGNNFTPQELTDLVASVMNR